MLFRSGRAGSVLAGGLEEGGGQLRVVLAVVFGGGVNLEFFGARVGGYAVGVVIGDELNSARHGAVVQDRQHRGAHLSSETVLVIKALNEHEAGSLATGKVIQRASGRISRKRYYDGPLP